MSVNKDVIQKELEKTALIKMEEIFSRVPFMKSFHLGHATHLGYFRRHLIETVVRMRLDIRTDAYALFKMRHLDNELSKKFGK